MAGSVLEHQDDHLESGEGKTTTVSEDNNDKTKNNVSHARNGAGEGDSERRTGPGRKPRACVECRKQKMRCEVLPGDSSCRHCLRRNIKCITKGAFHPRTSPEGGFAPPISVDYEKKIDSMREEILQMKDCLNMLLRNGNPVASPSVQHSVAHHDITSTPMNNISPGGTVLSAREDNTHMAMTRENSIEPTGSNEHVNGAVTVEEPMGSLYEVTRLRNIRSNRAKTVRPAASAQGELNDFISRGVISEAEAEELYKIFHTSLNHYLWVGLEQTHPNFSSVRQSSELLTATILTVTALHIPTSAETFDNCYKEFLSLISSSMFSRYHSIDDVRGLCIAAFWLSEVSWKLSGHAIRIATELSIHQSFSKALEGDREHFLRARLWYMLYVCDHHFSIAYGRPPMVSESQQIRNHELFLHSPFADALDRRILSQVALMQILTRVYDRFADKGMLNEQSDDFADLRSFNLDIDTWRVRWHARMADNEFIGSFPYKGIILYSYFAKLQMNSLAVRGVSLSQHEEGAGAGGRLSTERKEFANSAISAAVSILTFILEEQDLRRALVGTPLYVHTMVAFASVFLMKVATKWNRVMGLNVESGYVSHLLERMIVLLKSTVTSDRHLLYHIAAGLEKMLVKLGTKSGVTGKAVRIEDPVAHSPALAYGSHASNARQLNHGGFADNALINEVPSGWGPYSPPVGQGPLFDNMTIMNDSLIYEAFGSESANDVYNLLTSQFQY